MLRIKKTGLFLNNEKNLLIATVKVSIRSKFELKKFKGSFSKFNYSSVDFLEVGIHNRGISLRVDSFEQKYSDFGW